MDMDIQAQFGFRKPPFTREIETKEYYRPPHFDEVTERVTSTVKRRMSAALISVAGAGKTSALRAITQSLPDTQYDTRYIKVTGLSKRDMCREIARACDLPSAGNYPALVRCIQEGLEQRLGNEGRRPVLLLDEAHDMRPDVLGILRVLTNFSMDSRLVISFILAGQTGLGTLLKRHDLEDIFQRIQYFGVLRALSRDETMKYIEHRCTIAGAASTPFDNHAIDAIYDITRGNMRAIDRLARTALEEAARQQAEVVSHVEVLAARRVLWPA